MSVNNYKIRIDLDGKDIIIPLFHNHNEIGQGDEIDVWQDETVEKIINPVDDFEVTRYSHKPLLVGENLRTDINYKFNFFNREIEIENTQPSDEDKWVCDYNFIENNDENSSDFTDKELYYMINSFKKSFFKLDFYNSNNLENNKNLITVIIPTQQGIEREADIGTEIVPNIVDVKTPNFVLDFIGDKEGFFVYWLKNPGRHKIDSMYMTAKFFNARTGQFIRMLNTPQSNIPKKFSFENNKYYYYRVDFDYDNFEYSIYNMNTFKRDGITRPINWYEYINPNDAE